MQEFRGTGVALITPFKNDLSIDLEGFSRVIEYSIDGGVDYLVVLGTTAENATLTKEEKQQLIDQAIRTAGGKVPLVLGVGGNDTTQVVTELKERDLTAFSGILSVSPYYNRPSQGGIYAHYEAISDASPLPVIAYNVPGRTGSNMLPETTLKIARDFKNIVGIKEACGDMVQMLRLLQDRPEDFMIISGDDMLAAPLISAGGEGVISVLAQGMPKETSGMIKDALNGNSEKTYEAHYKLMPVIDLIFTEGNPAGIKALLADKGICKDFVRLPLIGASDRLKENIATYLRAI